MFSVIRNEDLKEMLESSKESLKLEAMKRIVQVGAAQHVVSSAASTFLTLMSFTLVAHF